MPKHEKQWEFLKNKHESNQLSHAYLFIGQKNLGKNDFAKKFVEFIGCKFPDLMLVEGNEEIVISKIREIQKFLNLKSYNGGYKAVIVENAHLMNQEAQNCFLKTLEEPKGKTLLILISQHPDLLLSTIFSRCHLLKFFGKPQESPEEKEQEEKILQEVLKVINKDIPERFQYVKSLDFEDCSLDQILKVLQKYYRELLLKDSIDAKRILKIIEEINLKTAGTNANPKLALEVLLMQI